MTTATNRFHCAPLGWQRWSMDALQRHLIQTTAHHDTKKPASNTRTY